MITKWPTDYAIANVQCQYESASEGEAEAGAGVAVAARADHNYEREPLEPPAFIISLPTVTQVPGSAVITNCNNVGTSALPAGVSLAPSISLPGASVISVRAHQPRQDGYAQPRQDGYAQPRQDGFAQLRQDGYAQPRQDGYAQPDARVDGNRRVRRSEELLGQAADCVSRGHTFQTVSDQFNIPISTIRFFMARKGILPRRRRGRSAQAIPTSPTEPPYHIQHYKLPDMLSMRSSDSNDGTDKPL